ncbi:MAG TPA: NADH-quinone oxidoreductase subunit J [Candidatus Omnitrophota bacterium]|nr:NADH-quinone oxidoreductase subunit J [Candidatus Omnitrophota bacterium]
MTIADLIFIGVAAMTITGAFLAVTMKNVFHNALALIVCLAGVAALFIFLNSEFLAVIEVIIYIGAIAIAIIFAIMLSRPMYNKNEKRSLSKMVRSLCIAALLFGGLYGVLQRTAWPLAAGKEDYSLGHIGKNLLGPNVLPFEIISLILLIAIVGALLLSSDRSEDAS